MILINPIETPLAFGPIGVRGLARLDPTYPDLLNRLITQWSRKRRRNAIRQRYVDAKAEIKNLNIALSDEIAQALDVVCGWPEKAVYDLAHMCMWDGIVSPDGIDDPFELNDLLDANRFDIELPQAIASEFTHSCVFITTTLGQQSIGEPPIVIMAHSAQWATTLWDRTRRENKAGLVINDTDDLGRPNEITLYTRDWIINMKDPGAGWWVDWKARNPLPRVPMEMMPYRPTLDRPFGRSRVNRPVMSIADRAIRTTLRMDVAAELFTSPGLLINGIDEETFESIKTWSWKMGTVKGISPGEEPDIKPEITTLPQQSMQPYAEQIRELAMEFAGITDIPISSLGIVQDNPASAEAMYKAKEQLVIEAQNANRTNGYVLSRVYQDVVMLRDGLAEVTPELARIGTRWRNPAMPSIVSQSDAMVKQIAAIPELAGTDVALEELGYSDEQIKRIRAQIRTNGQAGVSGGILDKLLGGGDGDTGGRETVPAGGAQNLPARPE